ncbi:protein ecdysoneless homolog [Curcuma longa]|uniref:protein ecdysoneless homolog n=1 Tax=Curcuma longa TaxID=136217 RepID=UPI003D9F0B06
MAATSASAALFPRRSHRVPDDTVFYAVYPDLQAALPPQEALSALRALHLHLHSLLSPLSSDYVWQHEPFALSLPSSLDAPCALCRSPPVPHLHGKLRFGDALDDEWLLVALLFAATSAVPSLTARVWDSDGEFLLIEAAFALPRWLEPDTADNRVFIRGGKLHIVPKRVFPDTPSLLDALAAVRSEEIDTGAPDEVQAAIFRKISGYPEKARANMQRVRVRVPLPVAQVLKEEPSLIALAVEGFYDRDVDSMKHAAKMERFLRSNKGDIEMVRISVRMSRAMYGQLVQQKFQAPRGYPMPSREEGPVVFMEAELGLKIACGFEMMYQERKQAGEEGKGSTWEAFKQSLESSGCFSGLLPGSKEYQRIMDSAFEYYKNSSLFSRTREIMNAPVQRIDEILSMSYLVDEFMGVELPPNDDDSWMYDGEEELNSAILERQKEMEVYESEKKQRKQKKGIDNASVSDDFNLQDITETMQAFVQKLSTFEGAEVPESRNSKSVELDTDEFMKAMQSMLGEASCKDVGSAARLEGHTSSSDMEFDDSEYDDDEVEEQEDENSEDGFMQFYSDALNEELTATTLRKSFLHARKQANNINAGPSNTARSNTADDNNDEFTPVDVDFNLVKSFLDSFSSQQGLPGPASNLLGLMGVKVPPPDAKDT